jgi:hypothetical protein
MFRREDPVGRNVYIRLMMVKLLATAGLSTCIVSCSFQSKEPDEKMLSKVSFDSTLLTRYRQLYPLYEFIDDQLGSIFNQSKGRLDRNDDSTASVFLVNPDLNGEDHINETIRARIDSFIQTMPEFKIHSIWALRNGEIVITCNFERQYNSVAPSYILSHDLSYSKSAHFTFFLKVIRKDTLLEKNILYSVNIKAIGH